ncbi:uncharacterized protein LOC128206108 [Mya arenaria]|uniref:uncharacterized protein LOC128206108 n=1 Tax=Mya arenaria TaxID=6604 RepID=UPI0022E1FA68|nr:uncharacterized protein LOC128206108 [Mya arenaria]
MWGQYKTMSSYRVKGHGLPNTQKLTVVFIVAFIMSPHGIILTASVPCYMNDTSSCVPVEVTECLTGEVTFNYTSLVYTNGSLSQVEIQTQLDAWSHLKAVPECWSIIQPFLCSVYLPRCDQGESTGVERPNRELCERVRSPCQVIITAGGQWPSFLDCEQDFYAENCGPTFYETSKFTTDGECVAPLISTGVEENWYGGMQGCGMQCEDPLYTPNEHKGVFILVAVVASLCVTSLLFTIITFVLDWKVGRKYPAVILFYINGCFLVATLGWMVQLMAGEGVTCRKDGTIRKNEPLIGSGESATCTIVFILVYYFTMAGVVWYVMLAYSWDIHFKALGTVRDDLSKKTAYFHIISWCLPLVLTIICLSTSVIDADSISGICFPGFTKLWVRVGYVLAPICISLTIGAVFSFRGLKTLIKVRKDSPPFIGAKATSKIHDTIIRLGVFILLTFVLVLITVCVHLYTFINTSTWENNLLTYTYCRSNISVSQIIEGTVSTSCEIESRPSVVAVAVHIITFFAASLVFSSWSWNKASINVWRRTFRRICNKPVNEPQRLHKHRLVARRMKRQKQRSNERLSISYGTDHDDPVGMRFERNSASSHSLSSGFAVSMPKHRGRRSMLNPHFRHGRRRHADSDALSQGSRKGSSRSSHRRSYESSMSQKLSDIEREIREEERRKRRKKKRKHRQNRIQPIFGPLLSDMNSLNSYKMKNLIHRQRHKSDSSDISKASANGVCVNVNNRKHFPMQSVGSSNNISDSILTKNTDSISEIDLPQTKPVLPDFSIFTAKAALLPTKTGEKGDNSNTNGNSTLKGANPSPSGSFRRGRRREVKLEMTETSFYQEDDENIEMGGNQVINCEENCHETGEVKGNLKELGPLVNEIFEQARASSGNGRSSTQGQRDPMGSSRLGSASSRGSRGSRGSQSKTRDFKYANTKVSLPPEVPRNEGDKTARKRPFSGDYILTSQRNSAKRDESTRKSQSQPNSRVSSATDGHKRQIGHNGKLDFTDGQSWSRFLQTKGYTAGQLFGPIQGDNRTGPSGQDAGNIFSNPLIYERGHLGYQGQNYRLNPGQLQLMDKSHFQPVENQTGDTHSTGFVVGNENTDEFGGKNISYSPRPYTNPFRKNRDPTEGDVLGDDPDVADSPVNVSVENTVIGTSDKCNAQPNVNVLNIEQEQIESVLLKRPYTNPYRRHRDADNDDDNFEEGCELNGDCLGKPGQMNVSVEVHKEAGSSEETVNILNVEAEHCHHCGAHKHAAGTVNVLDIAAEQMYGSGDYAQVVKDVDVDMGTKKRPVINVDVLNVEAEQSDHEKLKNVMKVSETECRNDDLSIIGSELVVNDNTNGKNRGKEVKSVGVVKTKTKMPKMKNEKGHRANPVVMESYIGEQGTDILEKEQDNKDINKNKGKGKATEENIIASPREIKTLAIETERNPINIAKEIVLKEGKFKDQGKVSAFDGRGLKGKQPLTNYAIKDPIKTTGAIVLAKKDKEPDVKIIHNTSKVVENIPMKTQVLGNKAVRANMKVESKPGLPIGPKLNAVNSNSVESDSRKSALPPRKRFGSQGSGSTSSRSTSAITRSSGTSRNSDTSHNENLDNCLPSSGNISLGFINENYKPPKDRSSSKNKVPYDKSVGMFDFLECDDFDSEYDDVSTDNLTDTYTYTDDDLTEVSSLPC